MSTTVPITATQMAEIVQRTVNAGMGCEIAEAPQGAAFEMTTPATGQRFRVTVAEVPGWSDQMDKELAEIAGTETQA